MLRDMWRFINSAWVSTIICIYLLVVLYNMVKSNSDSWLIGLVSVYLIFYMFFSIYFFIHGHRKYKYLKKVMENAGKYGSS